MDKKINFIIFLFLIIEKVLTANVTLSRQKRILPVIPPPPPFLPSMAYSQNSATGVLVAIAVPVPLPDQNVFVSYNFEANYNMVQYPNNSFPGPLLRVNLNDKYPETKLNSDASPDDVVARKLSDHSQIEEEIETTTIFDNENEHERNQRSLLSKIIFTRVGVYRLIESRLYA